MLNCLPCSGGLYFNFPIILNSSLTGFPIKIDLQKLLLNLVSLKDKAKIFTNLDRNLLALPRTAFCS
jgi:hypothetical protein